MRAIAPARASSIALPVVIAALTVASFASATERDRPVQCAECLAFTARADQALALNRRGVELNRLPVLIRTSTIDQSAVEACDALRHANASAGLELPLAALPIPLNELPDVDLLVLDVRESSISEADRFALRTVATEVRARRRDVRIGLELAGERLDTSTIAHLASLSAYVDFLVLPAGFDVEELASLLGGLELWTRAVIEGPVDLFERMTQRRPASPEHLLVDMPDDNGSLVDRIAQLRSVAPGGMTPPATIDADTPGAVAFSTGITVRGSRQLRVDEIIAKHQAAEARQRSIVVNAISSGSTVLTFQVPGFAGPFTVSANTVAYSSQGVTEIEQDAIRVNGLALQPEIGGVPRLPLVEPERVSTPPLTIALTDAYRYSLRGIERIGGRDAYVIAFEPLRSDRTLFAGTAWIDASTFGALRMDAAQTALSGPIVSSRQIDEFELVPHGDDVLSLLHRSETFQVYQGPTESTPIRRTMTLGRHDVNVRDFAARLDHAHRSTAVMLRDTPDGFRFLVRDVRTSAAAEPRRLASDPTSHVTTAVAGTVVDPNISVPLVFAGLSYVDFNLLGTGAQLNAFFGGTYARLSWSTPPIFGGWRLAGDGAAVAVSYNDRAIVHGVERYDENIRQRPAQLSIALVGPLARAIRLRASYDVGYTAYAAADTTAPAFVLPASTPVHALRVALEGEHGPWTATAWSSVARRQRWTPWGRASDTGGGVDRDFARVGATLARSFVWSPRAVGRVEAAWMAGSHLDRFSQFAFGTFDNALRGYPAVSIRYSSGAVARSVATWNASSHVRLDAFADVGFVRPFDETRWRGYPGVGAAAEVPIGPGWLAAAEWGYGVKGINTNGTIGTHVVRVTAYKMF